MCREAPPALPGRARRGRVQPAQRSRAALRHPDRAARRRRAAARRCARPVKAARARQRAQHAGQTARHDARSPLAALDRPVVARAQALQRAPLCVTAAVIQRQPAARDAVQPSGRLGLATAMKARQPRRSVRKGLTPQIERDLRVSGAANQEQQQRLAVRRVQRLNVDPSLGPPMSHSCTTAGAVTKARHTPIAGAATAADHFRAAAPTRATRSWPSQWRRRLELIPQRLHPPRRTTQPGVSAPPVDDASASRAARTIDRAVDRALQTALGELRTDMYFDTLRSATAAFDPQDDTN